MPRVANASVSRYLYVPDETCMSCLAHQVNNSMKALNASYCQTDVLQVVVQDFRSMKPIIEYANRSGWKHSLSGGYKKKQESKTRFGTVYLVVD